MKNRFFLLSKYTYFFEIGKRPQKTLAKLLFLLAHLSPRKLNRHFVSFDNRHFAGANTQNFNKLHHVTFTMIALI